MPTAAEAMAGAAGAGAGAGAAGAGAAGAGAAGAGAGAAGGQGQQGAPSGFWDEWKAPEQKDVREWAANKRYADPFTLARSARELEQQVGTLRATRPGYPTPETTADGKPTPAYEQAMKAWRMTTGVPESADKYQLPTIENNPYPQFGKYVTEMFHEAGVPAGLATQIFNGWEKVVQKLETEQRAAEDVRSQAAVLELQQEWGPNFQERAALAKRGWDFISSQVGGIEPDKMRLLEHALGSAAFMKVGWQVGAGNGEARYAGGNQGASAMQGGVSQAQARFAQLQADRGSGKISDHEWRALQPEIDSLVKQIAEGNAPAA